MAITQSDIDAITTTLTAQTTTLKTIATEVQTLVAAQAAGNTLDLTGLQAAATGAGAEITTISTSLTPAPPVAGPNPST